MLVNISTFSYYLDVTLKMKLLVGDIPRIGIKELLKICGKLTTTLLSLDSVKIKFKGREQDVFFASTKTNFGGSRLWLRCFWCKRRVTYLHYNHTKQLACRLCYYLGYKSQYKKKKSYLEYERYEDQLKKIKKRLENKYLKNVTRHRLKLKLMKLSQSRTYGQAPLFTKKRSSKL